MLFERALRHEELATLNVAMLGPARLYGEQSRQGQARRRDVDAGRTDVESAGGLAGCSRDCAGTAKFINFDRAHKGDGRLTGAGVWLIVTALGKATGQRVRPHVTAPCRDHRGPG